MTTSQPEGNRDLRETIRLANITFWQCRYTCASPGEVDLPSLALYMHMIRMADGVEILFGAKAYSPMIPLLRSMLESLMALDYIHQVDYEKRSLAWLCACIHQEIEFNETIDPSTERGKEFQEEARKQQRFWSDSFLKPESTTAQVKRLKMKLNEELFRDTEREYQTRKGKNDWTPKWYQLFGGPKNLFEMAGRTEWLAFFKIFYQPWSCSPRNRCLPIDLTWLAHQFGSPWAPLRAHTVLQIFSTSRT